MYIGNTLQSASLAKTLTNNEQYICYCIRLSLLTLVNINPAVHCLFSVH